MRRLALAALLCCASLGAHAATWSDMWLTRDQQAQRLLDSKQPAAAASMFSDARHQAYAQLQAGQYAKAADLLAPFKDPDSLYNRGNALAHTGQLRDALKAYDAALAASPGNRDVIRNRDLVRRALEQQSRAAQQNGSGKSGQRGQQGAGGSQGGGQGGGSSGSQGGSAAGNQSSRDQGSSTADAQSRAGSQSQAATQPQTGGQPGTGNQRQGDNGAPSGNQSQPGSQAHNQPGAGNTPQSGSQSQTDGQQSAGAQPHNQQGSLADNSTQQPGSTQNPGNQPGNTASAQSQPAAGQSGIGTGDAQSVGGEASALGSQTAREDAAAGIRYQQSQQAREAASKDATPDRLGAADARASARADGNTPPPQPRSEQALALDQWLRSIPEDSGELLRRKFLIEHMMRQQGDEQ